MAVAAVSAGNTGRIREVHHVTMQANEGPKLQALLECLKTFGVNRVIFPARVYRSDGADVAGRGNAGQPLYETAVLLPRGDDGGFAQRFLEERRNSRHMSDT